MESVPSVDRERRCYLDGEPSKAAARPDNFSRLVSIIVLWHNN